MNRIFILPAIIGFSAYAAVDAFAVEDIAAGCNDCHGDNGVSQWNDVPTIAGLDSFTGSESLYVYKDEARPCAKSEYRQGDTSRPATDMCTVAQDLDDDQIEAIAEHYAGLPFVPAEQDFDAALASQGEAVHEEHCDQCHSDGGSNPEDEASILAGQWMGYLREAFAHYKSGEREQPKKMQEKIDALSDADVEALLHYYASQQ